MDASVPFARVADLLFLLLIGLNAHAVPGDEHWDYHFGLPGVDGFVGAIITRGSDT